MSFPGNPAVSDIVATTIESRTGKLADNVTKNNALLMSLKKGGNIMTFSGGSIITHELSFAANGNAGFYSGYDLLPVAGQDVISWAQYDIKQAACPVVISGLEMLQNSGKEAIIDLMEGRLGVAESSMANLISQGLYSDGTGSGGKTITGLDAAVPAGTSTARIATGTYGGIDRSAWAFWQPYYVHDASLSSTTVQGDFNTLWSNLVRGSDRPNLIIVDNLMWSFYIASSRPNSASRRPRRETWASRPSSTWTATWCWTVELVGLRRQAPPTSSTPSTSSGGRTRTVTSSR